jgi:hypothetical protein
MRDIVSGGRVMIPIALWLLAVPGPTAAHHAIAGKFDDTQPVTLEGIVTKVDWRNPHVHVFMNVEGGGGPENWAVELESPFELERSGWRANSVRAGDAIRVEGFTARDGSRQAWSTSMLNSLTHRPLLTLSDAAPPAPLSPRPTPRWPDGRPRLGPEAGGSDGYWAYPSATAMVEDGVEVEMDRHGLLADLEDAGRVAPMQPWAEALYMSRQRRYLQDDPTYLRCKPPGGPRQFQLPQGVKFAEDRDRQRMFVLVGGGNHNYHIVYLDGREPVGQVAGDDDNPLYYGRSVGTWEQDTLVLETRGFNEDFWFTNGGLPHTDQLRLTERISRPDFDSLLYEVTVDDPGAYTRPWTSSWTLRWVSGDLPSHYCQENRP